MTSPSIIANLRKGNITSTALVIFAFAIGFTPRLLDTLGAPSIVNFIHFAIVPIALGVILAKTRINNRHQILIVQKLLLALLVLFTIGLVSAILNNTGLINVAIAFLLLCEPFILLLAIICLPGGSVYTPILKSWFSGLIFFHLFIIYAQFGAGFCNLPGDCDNVQGVFTFSGAGHVTAASVSCSYGVYFFANAKEKPIWLRTLVLILCFGNIITSDAKQVLLSFVIAFPLLALASKKPEKVFFYIIGFLIFGIIFNWSIHNVSFLADFAVWNRPELYGPGGEAPKLKFISLRVIVDNFSSPLHWLIGLGPGHTTSRLGGWMLRDYGHLLNPLGATQSSIGDQVWAEMFSNWLGRTGSTLFSPFWTWAAIWGDLGFLGLSFFIYCCFLIWKYICLTDVSRLLFLTYIVNGFLLTNMEEPGYTLAIAMLLGIGWHESRLSEEL